ncbi:hypothetical protein [Bradyrhizobium sp. USDA 4353]
MAAEISASLPLPFARHRHSLEEHADLVEHRRRGLMRKAAKLRVGREDHAAFVPNRRLGDAQRIPQLDLDPERRDRRRNHEIARAGADEAGAMSGLRQGRSEGSRASRHDDPAGAVLLDRDGCCAGHLGHGSPEADHRMEAGVTDDRAGGVALLDQRARSHRLDQAFDVIRRADDKADRVGLGVEEA